MIIASPRDVEGTVGCCSHGGVGEYFVRTLLDRTTNAGFKYVRDLTPPPGSTIGLHPHEGDEEIYFVIEGEGVMVVDDEEHPFEAGAVCLTPSGHSHALRNDGDVDLRIFVACVATPASRDRGKHRQQDDGAAGQPAS